MNLSDARVQHTRGAIRRTFLTLLQEKPLSSISVTELCAKSGINRTTFYKHYADVFDLMDCMEREVLLHLQQTLVSQTPMSLYELFTGFFVSVRDAGKDWWILGCENGDPALYAKMFTMVYEGNFPRVQKKLLHLSDETQQLLYHYLAQGCGGVIRHWLRSGARETPEALAAFLTQATNALMVEFCAAGSV